MGRALLVFCAAVVCLAEAVLFGGNRVLFGREGDLDTLLADTWVHRDGQWRRRDVPGPSARAEAVMAYDSRRRIVLFGGHDGETVFGDTWEWDGRRWTLMAEVPPRRRLDNDH